MVLRLDEDGSEDAYVNTAAGANYINASYVDVCGCTVFFVLERAIVSDLLF